MFNPNSITNYNYLSNENKYLGQIKVLQEKLPGILDDFKKYYVFHNKTPTYSEYQTMLENTKSNLNSINAELFTISNDVNKDIHSISESLVELNKLISEEKNKNNKLKNNHDNLNNNLNGSTILIDEYRQIYNENYLNNLFILLGIIGSSFLLVKIFTNKNNSSVSGTNMSK